MLEIAQTEGFHEGRDFQLLLEMLKRHSPDWILVVDADEVFEERLTRKQLQKMKRKRASHYTFRRFHMFGDRDHYMAPPEILKSYCNFGDRSLFRFSEKLYVPDKQIHTSIMGRPKFFHQSDYRILHLPFLYKEYRMKLYENYLNIDKNPRNTGTYKRDIHILSHPDTIRRYPFKKSLIAIKTEFYIYNILSLANSVKRKLKTFTGK